MGLARAEEMKEIEFGHLFQLIVRNIALEGIDHLSHKYIEGRSEDFCVHLLLFADYRIDMGRSRPLQ